MRNKWGADKKRDQPLPHTSCCDPQFRYLNRITAGDVAYLI